MTQYTFWNKVVRARVRLFSLLCYLEFHLFYLPLRRKNQEGKTRQNTFGKPCKRARVKDHKIAYQSSFYLQCAQQYKSTLDENPERARTAITELSNILRSSMQAEKIEMAPERELNIVKDYLELEHIRFEDRLMVEYDIDVRTHSTRKFRR